MKCPICNTEGASRLTDDVDIGVGTQEHTYGYECPKCGQIAVCRFCGALNGQHTTWCRELTARIDCSKPNLHNP